MKLPHFFTLQSRLGLKYPPLGSSQLNLGVETGGKEILTPDFTFEFDDSVRITHLIASSPDEYTTTSYISEVGAYYSQIADFITAQLRDDEIQVVLGGDHSVSFASLLSVLRREGAGNVGLVMFDSHADLHLQRTSPSGNIHGMWVRMLCDDFDDAHIRSLVGDALDPNHIRYVGNVLTESEEDRYISAHQIHVADSAAIREGVAQELETFVRSFPHIHLSFDIDVFAQLLVPATGTPNPNGLTPAHVMPLLEIFRQLPSFSMDLVEVNPQKDGAAQTLELARDVLRKVLI